MVGDRSYDVNGARANGIPCIGVLWGIGTFKELEVRRRRDHRDPVELGPASALGVMSRP